MRRWIKISGKGKVAYFDCYSGVSGDMTLGALLDCGVDPGQLKQMLSSMELDDYSIEIERVSSYGLTGTRVTVKTGQSHRRFRYLPDIERLIKNSNLPETVIKRSLSAFQKLARAEAAVHGTVPEKVHFHEIGAVDSIVDIVGSITALYLLGIETVFCSPLPLGRGMVSTAHGSIPLPAPATLELLKEHGVPVYGKETELELVTPTGASLVCTLAAGFGSLPPLIPERLGYGAGTLDPGYPNLLRIITGTAEAPGTALQEEQVHLIEANIDDLNPEIFGYLMDRLLVCGALDVYYTPVQMKKNRPAVKLTVLASKPALNRLINLILTETSTLGVRLMEARKIMHRRRVETVNTEWGPVRVKYVPSSPASFPVHFSPEYEDCLAVARQSGVPLKEVYRQVEYLFRNRFQINS